MILWKKYNGVTLEFIEKIGWLDKDPLGGSRYSSNFIVMVRFVRRPDEPFEPMLANLIMWSGTDKADRYHISVHGMMGNLEISHYSQINTPKK